ncbi:MAG: PQQ-binding-like beta-propeller repeat protein, partial [Planctomycetota bacterium]
MTLGVCGALCLFNALAAAADDSQANWGQWRGPLATGEAPQADPPIRWSETDAESVNIRWKTPIPGRGHATPIVWDDHLFVTTAVPTGDA